MDFRGLVRKRVWKITFFWSEIGSGFGELGLNWFVSLKAILRCGLGHLTAGPNDIYTSQRLVLKIKTDES